MPTKECQKCCDHDAHTDKINNIIMTRYIAFSDGTSLLYEGCCSIKAKNNYPQIFDFYQSFVSSEIPEKAET